jgi:phage repressor protein C with HTH and peptisase S24 domain
MQEQFNLLEIRELYGLSQVDFARKIGYSREVVNKVESGRMKASKWLIEAVQKFVSEHQKADFSHDVNILGKALHSVNKKAAEPYVHQRWEQKNVPSDFLVPLVGIKAQAGYIKGFEETDYMEALEKYSLPPGVNPTGAVWRYFEIDGDSMEPTFSPGDVVLATMVPHVDWQDIKNFYVYVILTADQLLIKRIYKKSDQEWVLVSDNEEVAPQTVIQVEDIKQLWLMRRHIRSKVPQPKEFKITA